jgi:hypothetical protein
VALQNELIAKGTRAWSAASSDTNGLQNPKVLDAARKLAPNLGQDEPAPNVPDFR